MILINLQNFWNLHIFHAKPKYVIVTNSFEYLKKNDESIQNIALIKILKKS